MRAKKCDRCGKLHEYYEGTKIFKENGKANGLLLIDRDLNEQYYGRKSYDLCPDCMEELMAFLKKEGKT